MGLDSVELVMAVEQAFDIEIPNHSAQNITTVGALHFFVMYTLKQSGREQDTDAVFERLRGIICERLSVKPVQVVPAARFVQDLGMD